MAILTLSVRLDCVGFDLLCTGGSGKRFLRIAAVPCITKTMRMRKKNTVPTPINVNVIACSNIQQSSNFTKSSFSQKGFVFPRKYNLISLNNQRVFHSVGIFQDEGLFRGPPGFIFLRRHTENTKQFPLSIYKHILSFFFFRPFFTHPIWCNRKMLFGNTTIYL